MKHTMMTLALVLLACQATFAKRYTGCNAIAQDAACHFSASYKPRGLYNSLVYCGNTPAYLSTSNAKRFNAYVERDINLVLRIQFNGQTIDKPCA